MYKHNQVLKIREDHPYHAGKIGYFRFMGRGPSKNCIVVASHKHSPPHKESLFVVAKEDII